MRYLKGVIPSLALIATTILTSCTPTPPSPVTIQPDKPQKNFVIADADTHHVKIGKKREIYSQDDIIYQELEWITSPGFNRNDHWTQGDQAIAIITRDSTALTRVQEGHILEDGLEGLAHIYEKGPHNQILSFRMVADAHQVDHHIGISESIEYTKPGYSLIVYEATQNGDGTFSEADKPYFLMQPINVDLLKKRDGKPMGFRDKREGRLDGDPVRVSQRLFLHVVPSYIGEQVKGVKVYGTNGGYPYCTEPDANCTTHEPTKGHSFAVEELNTHAHGEFYTFEAVGTIPTDVAETESKTLPHAQFTDSTAVQLVYKNQINF